MYKLARVVLDYKLPYHVIQEDDEEVYLPKLSFKTLEEAEEFIRFASHSNLLIVKTKDLRFYYLGTENKKYQL